MLLDVVASGDFPFWQRSIDAGFPMWGSSEMAILHFTTWLFAAVRPVQRALTLGLLTHLVLAALGMYLWLRYRGRSAGAAAAGAFVVALGGFTTVHLEHWTFSGSLLWIPWALWAVDAFIDRGRPRSFALAAIAIAGMWLAGSAQVAYFGTLIVGGHAFFRVLPRPGRAWILLALPAGLALASPIILASAELSFLGPRAAGTTIEFAGFHYRWTDLRPLALFLVPHAWGPPNAWSGPIFIWETTPYLGIAPLALAVATRPRGIGWFYAALTVFALLLCFGTTLAVWEFAWRHLPGYASFRVPTRGLFVVNFAGAFLFAEGLDRLARHDARTAGRIAVIAACAGAAALAWWIGDNALALGFRSEAMKEARWAIAIASMLAAWVVVLEKRIPPPVFAAGVAALCFVDLHHLFSHYMPVRPAQGLAAQFPPLSRPRWPAPRIALIQLPVNLAAAQHIESANGYSQVMVGRIFDLLHAGRSGRFLPSATTPIGDEYGHQDLAPYRPFFSIWATSVVSSAYPLHHPLLQLAGSTLGVWHYRYLAPLPAAFWSGRYRVSDDETFRREVGSFDPQRDLVLAPSDVALAPPTEIGDRRAATLIARRTNSTELEIDAASPGILVLLDPWFPGWAVEVDGRPAPLLRANYAFMGVPVEAGRHRVRFRYFPATLPLALGLIGIAVLATAAGWWLWARHQRSTLLRG
jgi:hypothetical protein